MSIDRPSMNQPAASFASPTSDVSGTLASINDTISTTRFATSPSSGGYAGGRVSEWGVTTSIAEAQTLGVSQVGVAQVGVSSRSRAISDANSSSTSGNHGPPPPPQTVSTTTTNMIRPRSSGRATTSRPLTVANYNENNPEEADQAQQAAQVVANARSHARQQSLQARAIANSNAGSSRQWMSAEEEKKRLYDNAVAQVERTQGDVIRGPNAPRSEVCFIFVFLFFLKKA